MCSLSGSANSSTKSSSQSQLHALLASGCACHNTHLPLIASQLPGRIPHTHTHCLLLPDYQNSASSPRYVLTSPL
jgi:hypothetical protein